MHPSIFNNIPTIIEGTGSMKWNCRNKCLLLPLVAAALLDAHAILVVSAPSGFINIDCGKEKDYNYTDTDLGLAYTSDFQYIDTGEIHNIVPSAIGSELYKQGYDLRSFPNGTRNCFTVKQIQKGGRYLVKASFMYGNYDGKNSTPQFDLYLGVNFWSTISFSKPNLNYIHEIMTVTTSDQISVCLVNTGQGVPFISALELRLLPSDMYDEYATSSQALVLFGRTNLGGNYMRYPNDAYDRFWAGHSDENWKTLSNTSPVDSTGNAYKPPSDAMKTASYPSVGSTMNLIWNTSGILNTRFHVIFQFAELQQLKVNETRNFSIILNGNTFAESVDPSYLKAESLHTPNPITKLEFSLVGTNQSTLPPIINAAEVYIIRDTTGPETDSDDVDAATTIKAEYKVKRNWMGDPCSPTEFMWDGINCSNKGFTNFRIISMKLSSSGLTGEISTSFENLSELQHLDLSNNKLTGGVPDALANLTHLKLLDLSGNRLNGQVPQVLLDRSAAGSLTLRIDNSTHPGSLDEHSRKKSTGKIVIAVVVSVATVVLLGLLAIFALKKIKTPGKQKVSNTGKQTQQKISSPIHLESNQFTADDLAKITHNFDKEIGRGGFGSVYYGVLSDGTEVAVKKLSRSSAQGPEQFKTEAHLLTNIHHRNLVSLVGSCNGDSNLALVYEYMAQGSLQDHLTGKGSTTLSWVNRLKISVEAAKGLEYLHVGCQPAIVHRDVKTSNILLNKNLEAKISDFGLSKLFQNDFYTHISTIPVGTLGYIDPAYHSTNMLNEKSDVYSFGVVLFEVITGRPAIVRNNSENISLIRWVRMRAERGQIDEIIDRRIYEECDRNCAWKMVETAMECVSQEPVQRPTMTKVLIVLGECLEMAIADAANKYSSNMDSIDTWDISMMNTSTMPLQPSTR